MENFDWKSLTKAPTIYIVLGSMVAGYYLLPKLMKKGRSRY